MLATYCRTHRACVRRLRSRLLAMAMGMALAACGGGGGGAGGVAATGATVVFPPSMARLTDANVVPVLVQAGPGRNANMPYVSVTVCRPGGQSCKTIDQVLLDTGSTGLRLFASQLQQAPALALPAQTIQGSSTVFECAQFSNMVAWGTVQLADVVLGGERATAVPVQLMADDAGTLPAACAGTPMVSTLSGAGSRALHANGILGVGLFSHDGQRYFGCPEASTACSIEPADTEQVQNPVALFATNNNGLAIQLPTVPPQGAGLAQGYLIFGVGTQSNNQLAAAKVVPVDPYSGYFTTTYLGVARIHSRIDSGSNGLFFPDADALLPPCAGAGKGFYCPASTRQLSASIALAGSQASIGFGIGSASQLFAPGTQLAFGNLGGPASDTFFSWGLPFFFGRTVFTVIAGHSVGAPGLALPGPFYAFSD